MVSSFYFLLLEMIKKLCSRAYPGYHRFTYATETFTNSVKRNGDMRGEKRFENVTKKTNVEENYRDRD